MRMLSGIEGGFNGRLDRVPITVRIEKPMRSYHHIDDCWTRRNSQGVIGKIRKHLHSPAVEGNHVVSIVATRDSVSEFDELHRVPSV